MSNSIALRIAIFGGVALVLFGILFFRLWFLQVLNGDQYLAEANNNRTREFRVSAPRGNILDREGDTLVTNRVSLALQVNPQKLPEDGARKRAELKQLAELTHTTLPRLRRAMRKELKLAPGLPVTLRRDVGNYLVYYLEENKGRFPGVDVERVFVRRYPKETFAAHILGSVGEVDEEDLEEPRYRGLEAGESVRVDPRSMADGLSAPFAGEQPIRICRERDVETVLVSEDEITEGMRFLYGRAKLACEPAAAVGVAALLAGKIDVEPHDTVAVVVSGGNVAPEMASAILASNEGRNPS